MKNYSMDFPTIVINACGKSSEVYITIPRVPTSLKQLEEWIPPLGRRGLSREYVLRIPSAS